MTKRQRRQLLWLLNLLLVLGIAWAATLALFPPQAAPQPDLSAQPEQEDAGIEASRALPINAYAAIYKNNLQAPLVDKPSQKDPATGPSPLPKLALTGTVVEADNSYGVFRTSSGEISIAGVGDMVDGAKVVSLTEDSATLTYGSRSFTLKIPRESEGK